MSKRKLSEAEKEQVSIKEYLMDTIKEHEKLYEQRFIAQERMTAAAMLAADRAVTKAEIASEKRFDSVNEFRAQLSDQASTFLRRSEFEVTHSALVEKLDASNKSLQDKIDMLRSFKDESSGKVLGINSLWAIGIALLVAVESVVTIMYYLHSR